MWFSPVVFFKLAGQPEVRATGAHSTRQSANGNYFEGKTPVSGHGSSAGIMPPDMVSLILIVIFFSNGIGSYP
jgi:hypothetical protein